jgi:hypothetical protein
VDCNSLHARASSHVACNHYLDDDEVYLKEGTSLVRFR